ncbi:hypothetical protein EIP91_011953 [Steccherinum ochraceum]|uniref:Uncharacterized protein n=1 Tax=Steccherinum ochraceum TaxID=92696 RepID=A0A4V2MWW4_9APHY|nr:hypothetical protein EIP91_011953 [Steccherinum ochraceum]
MSSCRSCTLHPRFEIVQSDPYDSSNSLSPTEGLRYPAKSERDEHCKAQVIDGEHRNGAAPAKRLPLRYSHWPEANAIWTPVSEIVSATLPIISLREEEDE